VKNLDFKDDMRKLFGLENEQEKTSAQEHAKEEREDGTAAESKEVAKGSDEVKEGEALQHEESASGGHEEGADRREALDDALRGEEEEKASEESSQESVEKSSEEAEIEPPKHWKKADREMFSSLGKEAKEFLLTQEKHYQGDYMRKVNDIKGLVSALDPLKEEMAKRGLSRSQVVQSLVATHLNMRDTPAETIKQLFVNYGVDPIEFVQNWDKVSELNDVLKKKQIENATGENKEEAKRRQEFVAKRLNEWAAQDGHEHAEMVEPQMAAIVNTCVQQGKPIPHIDDIYEEACWAHPTVRKKMIQAESLKSSVEDKKRLEKSKKAAGSSVKAESEGKKRTKDSSEMTQREELAALLSKAG